jgi:hypothetical protein
MRIVFQPLTARFCSAPIVAGRSPQMAYASGAVMGTRDPKGTVSAGVTLPKSWQQLSGYRLGGGLIAVHALVEAERSHLARRRPPARAFDRCQGLIGT